LSINEGRIKRYKNTREKRSPHGSDYRACGYECLDACLLFLYVPSGRTTRFQQSVSLHRSCAQLYCTRELWNFVVNVQPLREKLQAITEEFGNDSVSLYVEYLNTGANISINPEHYLWPASLAKIPLALSVMKKVERGEWKLGNELVLMPGDRNDESGASGEALAEYPIGTRFTIEKLLEELLVNSDNTAHFILYRNMHNDELNRIIEDLGLEALFTEEGRVSAKEYSKLFRALYTSNLLTREHSEMILRWLDSSPFNDFLSRDISPEIPFPHKYGEKVTLNVYADSGIVYLPNRPYLITVIIAGNQGVPIEAERARAAEFMRRVSAEVYAYFSQAR
jgi:hypothetical protein